jgi:hypothetical protein
LANVSTTPLFRRGPDMFDTDRSVWWDMTTDRQWQRHVDDYTDDYGTGVHLSTAGEQGGPVYIHGGRVHFGG